MSETHRENVSDDKLRQWALNGLVYSLAIDEMGVYCQAVSGGPRPYKKRNAYHEGWNAYGDELLQNASRISKWLKTIPDQHRRVVEDLLLDYELELSVREEGVQLWVNCSDTFYWGCADAEQITFEELPALVECLSEVRCGGELWCCRKRGMRPQTASYEECYPPEDWPKFDACGPERTDPDGQRPPAIENYEKHQQERAARVKDHHLENTSE